jgi:hypothetical protein
MYLPKQDLSYVPFDQIYREYKKLISGNDAMERAHYEALLRKKEQEWNDTHEAPFEGNFSDYYPFTPKQATPAQKVKALEEVVANYKLKNHATWMLPQVAAYVAKMKLPEGDLIDPRDFLKLNFSVDDWHKGLYLYCTIHSRSKIMGTQMLPDFVGYSGLVPLLMMPFKKFHNIPYSKWSKEGLNLIVDSNLYEAMMFKGVLPLDANEYRASALAGKSGVTYHKLTKTVGTPFHGMPWLCQVMASQIWGAHPSNRSEYMILDWLNWDSMPDPIISLDVVPDIPKKISSASQLPWDD